MHCTPGPPKVCACTHNMIGLSLMMRRLEPTQRFGHRNCLQRRRLQTYQNRIENTLYMYVGPNNGLMHVDVKCITCTYSVLHLKAVSVSSQYDCVNTWWVTRESPDSLSSSSVSFLCSLVTHTLRL